MLKCCHYLNSTDFTDCSKLDVFYKTNSSHQLPLQGFTMEMQVGSVAVHSCKTCYHCDCPVSELCCSCTDLLLNTDHFFLFAVLMSVVAVYSSF